MTNTALDSKSEMSQEVVNVALFRRGIPYISQDCDERTVGGRSMSVCLSPPIVLIDDTRWVRSEVKRASELPVVGKRHRIILDALHLFGRGRVVVPGIGEQTFEDFVALMGDTCGLPATLIERWCNLLEGELDVSATRAEPSVGGIEAISLPANTFVCLSTCIEALLRADVVWIRPSRYEPIAAARFVGSLVTAGWPPARLGLYPTDHAGLLTFVDCADRALVFGGEGLPPALGRRSHVKIRGPGCTRALVSRAVDVARAATWLTRAIAEDAGRFCTNVGTILYCGDAAALGGIIAERLDEIRLYPDLDPCYPQALPAIGTSARVVSDWIVGRMKPGDQMLTVRPLIIETGVGALLAPCVIKLTRPKRHPLIGVELPFPFAVIAEVDERQQAAFCTGAGFVYALGYESADAGRGIVSELQCTHIDLNSNS